MASEEGGPTCHCYASRNDSRHIPAAVRDEVIVRDECRCTAIGADGVRCSETTHLEIDHIRPYSLGGGHEVQNLRLLCRPHNQLHAERTLGREFMERFQSQSPGSDRVP